MQNIHRKKRDGLLDVSRVESAPTLFLRGYRFYMVFIGYRVMGEWVETVFLSENFLWRGI